MTKEEAIEKLKQKLKPSKYGGYCVLGYNKKYCFGKSDFEAIETVLSMLQEQQEENKKKDKIIDLMARFMTNKDIDEDICRYQVVEHCKDEKYGVTTNVCINCIKQYFERKVEDGN